MAVVQVWFWLLSGKKVYDALGVNDSAVQVLGDETLTKLEREML